MKFSVITINYNNCSGLIRTINSIIGQTFKDFELIIIDGGSSDGSVEQIRKVEEQLAYWCSEHDRGVYNAMNKGVGMATGEYSIFMNSGDCFHRNDVLERFSRISCDVAAGYTDCVIWDSDNVAKEVKKQLTVPMEMTGKQIIQFGINHQSVFIKTELLRIHPYDENLKFVSDYKFFIQALVLDSCTYEALPVVVADYDFSGMTSVESNKEKMDNERLQVLEELIPLRIVTDYENYINGHTELQRIINKYSDSSMYFRILTKFAIVLDRMQLIYLKLKRTIFS